MFSQSREQFYNAYPNLNNTELVGTGDGVTQIFAGTLTAKPVVPGEVSFTTIAVNGTKIAFVDTQDVDPATGELLPTGTLDQDILPGLGAGTINYVTGAWQFITSPTPECPAAATPIYCQAVPYVAARPMSILYFEDKFIVRPIPDMPYRVELEAYIRPTELLNATDEPMLSQWWQYIAYGAAKKVFEDRMDMDSLQLIIPEYKHQERLINRKILVQQSNERVSTIFTEQGNGITGGGWGGGLF